MKRVRKHKAFDFLGHFFSLFAQSRELSRQPRQDDGGGLSAQDHDRLLGERLNDFSGPGLAHARSEFNQPVSQLFLAEWGELRRRGITLQQIKHRGMIQMRTNRTFQRRMDLCQQTTDAIAGLGDLTRQIFIKAAKHRQFRDFVIGQSHRTQRMRHAAGSLCDDVRVSSVGLGLPSMQIGNASHRKTRQVGNPHAFCLCNRNGKCSDGGGLIHDKQDLTMFFQLSKKRPQLRFVIGQSGVQKTFTLAIQRNRMMSFFAHVQTDEDVNALMLLNVTHACS